jgi:hypothetical protein
VKGMNTGRFPNAQGEEIRMTSDVERRRENP